MIHFAYPNASPTQGIFLGCGRYVASSLDEPPVDEPPVDEPPVDELPGNGYDMVQLNIPNIAQVSQAALILAPESSDSEQVIYEIKDPSPQRFIGESLELAYLLALISRSRQLGFQISTDIWCTGCVGIGNGVTPLLTTVDVAGFDIKLRAFLSEGNNDKLFIVPAANVQPIHQVLFREHNASVLSLSQFQNLTFQEEKVILKVHLNDLGLLTDTAFNKPAKSADEEKISRVWGYGVPWRNRDSRHRKRSMKVSNFGGKEIEISLGSITRVKADAIASSDDNYLTMGGGVSRAIRRAGGYSIRREARNYTPAKLGSAVITSAGRLRAKYVIHAVVIDFDEEIWPDADIVQMATASCLSEADHLECRTIAMPALGTGAGRLDVESVVYAMIDTIFEQLESKRNLQKVTIVLYRQDILFDYLKTSLEKRTFYL